MLRLTQNIEQALIAKEIVTQPSVANSFYSRVPSTSNLDALDQPLGSMSLESTLQRSRSHPKEIESVPENHIKLPNRVVRAIQSISSDTFGEFDRESLDFSLEGGLDGSSRPLEKQAPQIGSIGISDECEIPYEDIVLEKRVGRSRVGDVYRAKWKGEVET